MRSGSGKTHLLQAVCAAAAGDGAPRYLSRLATASVSALARREAALRASSALAVLCVDDVDAVAGDLAWERALFRLFNEAAELRTRLIFAAAAPPRQADWRLEDWRSRAAACVVYQLRELDDDGRIEALRLRAAQRGLQLPYETSEYLLKRMPRDMRSLFEILDPTRRGVAGGSAPAHHSLHPRCAREARKNKIIVQNHPNTSSKLIAATQRAAGLASNSVRANARYGIANKVAQA